MTGGERHRRKKQNMIDLGRTESVCRMRNHGRLRQSNFLPFGRLPGGSRCCMAITTMAIRRKEDAEESQGTQEREGV